MRCGSVTVGAKDTHVLEDNDWLQSPWVLQVLIMRWPAVDVDGESLRVGVFIRTQKH